MALISKSEYDRLTPEEQGLYLSVLRDQYGENARFPQLEDTTVPDGPLKSFFNDLIKVQRVKESSPILYGEKAVMDMVPDIRLRKTEDISAPLPVPATLPDMGRSETVDIPESLAPLPPTPEEKASRPQPEASPTEFISELVQPKSDMEIISGDTAKMAADMLSIPGFSVKEGDTSEGQPEKDKSFMEKMLASPTTALALSLIYGNSDPGRMLSEIQASTARASDMEKDRQLREKQMELERRKNELYLQKLSREMEMEADPNSLENLTKQAKLNLLQAQTGAASRRGLPRSSGGGGMSDSQRQRAAQAVLADPTSFDAETVAAATQTVRSALLGDTSSNGAPPAVRKKVVVAEDGKSFKIQ